MPSEKIGPGGGNSHGRCNGKGEVQSCKPVAVAGNFLGSTSASGYVKARGSTYSVDALLSWPWGEKDKDDVVNPVVSSQNPVQRT
jgi:hypothetical protein